MSKGYSITRRDFVNGLAVSVGVGASLSPMKLFGGQSVESVASGSLYPPQLTGLRGNHTGSFEVAHSVARAQKKWADADSQTDSDYDLVVVGGGISGLSAALLYQQRVGKKARILILDNHDDFGGHAKRNEFTVDGHNLIAYGGSQSIEAPAQYSAASRKLLQDLAIDTQRFYKFYDRNFNEKWGLMPALYFSADNYGTDQLTGNPFSWQASGISDLAATVEQFPIPAEARQSLLDFMQGKGRLTPVEWSTSKTMAVLRKTSFTRFLHEYAGVSKLASDIFRDSSKGVWGVGWDSLSTLEAIRDEMMPPARVGLTYADIYSADYEEEPYIFHFPDGNAGVARAIVRRLIPQALPGGNMEDLVSNRVNYAELDKSGSSVRLRLNSTAVRVVHSRDNSSVQVSYVRDGQVEMVRAKNTILAGNNNFLPFLCPEMKQDQISSLAYAAKVPLVYTNIALRNWRAFEQLGCSSFTIPKADMHHAFSLDFPVSMGAYQFSPNPDSPIVVHAVMIPAQADQGLSSREQHRIGRQRLYETSFAQYEDDVVNRMNGALGPAGFDAQRDIAAITVNRWPHGYAYEYNELFDPQDWGPEKGPHIAGRAGWGRISIANADASAYAYVNGAIDAAHRAVKEQLNIR